jgi:UrcA family protein
MRPNRYFGILSGLILLGTAALSSTVALAADPPTVVSLSINYVRADLENTASAEALYHRIQRAAREVCQQPNVREVDRYRIYKACYDRAVDTAVANVDATALTAVHHSHTRTQAAG